MSQGSNHFRPFEFRELKATGGASTTRRYDEPKFASHRDAGDIDRKHREANHFALDQTVAGQLGIHERQREETEARLRAELDLRLEQASEQAEAAGYAKGLAEGKAEALRAELPRVAEKIEMLDRTLQQFDQMRERIFAANEGFLVDIIAQVARMVALQAVQVDPDYIRRLVTALLHQLATKDDLKIFLSESDFANIESLRTALEKEFGKLSNTSIEVSAEVATGGCKIETRFGVVDASVGTQIENVMRALRPEPA